MSRLSSSRPQPAVGRVLLVDAASSARDALARSLERLGFDLFAVERVDEALAAGLVDCPAFVVTELRLRHGSGLTIIEELRPRLPNTEFVVLTSYGSVATTVRALRLGARAYLTKPVGAVELAAALGHGPRSTTPSPSDWDHRLTLDQAIWEYVHRTLEMAGSVSEAARRLGLARQSLKRMLGKYRPPSSHRARAVV